MMPAQLSPTPVSPVADALAATAFVSGDKAAVLSLADISRQSRFGCKGPGAIKWLTAQGVPVPAQPNTVCALGNGQGRVLRLGMTEFLIEGDAALLDSLSTAPRASGVYPVLRQDACLLLQGRQLRSLLLQSCNVNFDALDLAAAPVVLTSMVGVGVTVMPEKINGALAYRVWCDGTYGDYLWQTLRTIAEDLGGGAVMADDTIF